MKKIIYVLCFMFFLGALCSCKKEEPITLTEENINEYLIFNIIEEECESEYAGSYRYYYKNIRVISSSKVKANYSDVVVCFDLVPTASMWVEQRGKQIEIPYDGKSENQIYVSSEVTDNRYVCIATNPQYEIIFTKVSGTLTLE